MQKEVDRVNQILTNSPAAALETIHAIMHLVRSQQLRGLKSGAHDLAHMEVKVLVFFARHPGATQSDLVLHSGRDKAQVARLIKGLRDGGMLDALPDPLDRRSTHLSLSDKGRDVFATLDRHNEVLGEAAMQGLSAQERLDLLALLERVRSNLAPRA